MKELVVISGKGGTGKTSITASLASLWGRSVISDCDVDAADLYLLLNPKIEQEFDFYSGALPEIDASRCTECGLCRESCHYGAISEDFRIDSISCEGCKTCAFICPEEAITIRERRSGTWFISDTRYGPFVHARLGIAEENSGKLVTLLRRKAKEIAELKNIPLLLTDGSPGIGCPVISSISGADLILIVTEPTLSGKHDLKRVLELCTHFSIKAAVLINKADINESISGAITEESLKNGAHFLGRIPYDETVTRAMIQGVPFGELPGEASERIRDVKEQLHKILFQVEI